MKGSEIREMTADEMQRKLSADNADRPPSRQKQKSGEQLDGRIARRDRGVAVTAAGSEPQPTEKRHKVGWRQLVLADRGTTTTSYCLVIWQPRNQDIGKTAKDNAKREKHKIVEFQRTVTPVTCRNVVQFSVGAAVFLRPRHTP